MVTGSELRKKLEDAEGESAHCADEQCPCHDVPSRIREQLEELGDG